jgi:hypothetical protein
MHSPAELHEKAVEYYRLAQLAPDPKVQALLRRVAHAFAEAALKQEAQAPADSGRV